MTSFKLRNQPEQFDNLILQSEVPHGRFRPGFVLATDFKPPNNAWLAAEIRLAPRNQETFDPSEVDGLEKFN
jgi:hypothetical protein